jgi:hypothetical protein
MTAELYLFLRDTHYWLSRIGLAVALILFVIAAYIGLIRHGDVTVWFRRVVYAVFGLMAAQTVIGLAMYATGFRPHEEVHLIYGVGALLALPFFIYVEKTATRRPAMGSYIWAFFLLAAIIVRTIMTGAAG